MPALPRGSPPAMRTEVAARRSHRMRLAGGPAVHRIPLRNAMPGVARRQTPSIGRSAAPAPRCGGGMCGWRQFGQHRRTRLWLCGQREERCPHSHRRSISRSNQIRCLPKAVAARRNLVADALAASRGAARSETKPDDTLPSRHSAPGYVLARNKNEADRSRATKTGHID